MFTLAFFFNDIFLLYHCFYWQKWSHPQIFLHFWAVMILGVWGHLLMLLTLYFLKLLYVASYCGSCHFNKLLMLFCCFHNFSSFFFLFFLEFKDFQSIFLLVRSMDFGRWMFFDFFWIFSIPADLRTKLRIGSVFSDSLDTFLVKALNLNLLFDAFQSLQSLFQTLQLLPGAL